MQMNRRFTEMLSGCRYCKHYLTFADWGKATLTKVSREEQKKSDAEYINRGLARPPAAEGAGELVSGKTPRIPLGHVEVRGERYEIGIPSCSSKCLIRR